MPPTAAALAVRRSSLSIVLPDCPFEASSRTPSPLPQGLYPSSWSHRTPTGRARQRRVSAPDLAHAQEVSCGPGKGRPRRPSLSGLAGQLMSSSPLQLLGRKGNLREVKKEQKDGKGQVGAVGEAPRGAVITREEELLWWSEFTPEEQAEMRRMAINALEEWVESNEPQAEEWLGSTAARDLRGERARDGEYLGEHGEAACSPLQHSQVSALYKAIRAGELDTKKAVRQYVEEPSGRGSLLPEPGECTSSEPEMVKDPETALESPATENGVSGSEGSAGKQHWFHRAFGSFDARIKGLILLNLLTFLYGSNVAVLKNSNSVLDPATFAAGRFGIGSLAFCPWLFKALKDPRIRRAGGELGFWASTGYLTQAVALETTDAGRVSFISTFTVIVVPLLAGFLGKKIAGLTWVSAAVALAGVGLLESSGAPPAVGDAWALLSALLFGVQMLRTEHHSRALRKEDSMAIISLQMTVTAAASGLWALVGHIHSGDFTMLNALLSGDVSTLAHGFSGVPWWPMLYTGVFSTALCLWIEVVSLHDVSATEAALVYTIEPLWGAAFAWLLLGERWGPTGWLGAALILGGSLTTQFLGKDEEVTEPSLVVAHSPADSAGTSARSPTDSVDIDSFTRALSLYALSEMAAKDNKDDQAAAGRTLEEEDEKVAVSSRTSREGLKRRVGK